MSFAEVIRSANLLLDKIGEQEAKRELADMTEKAKLLLREAGQAAQELLEASSYLLSVEEDFSSARDSAQRAAHIGRCSLKMENMTLSFETRTAYAELMKELSDLVSPSS